MTSKQKLELTWLGKDKEVKIEPRILIENKELSNIENDPNTENMIIHGDNLLALKALEQKYSGQVKCIYIEKKIKEWIHKPTLYSLQSA